MVLSLFSLFLVLLIQRGLFKAKLRIFSSLKSPGKPALKRLDVPVEPHEQL